VSAVALLVMYLVKAPGLLRVSKDGELEGLDLHEHGTPAYHMEFGQGMTYTTLIGAGSFMSKESGRADAPSSSPAGVPREPM